MRRRLIVAAFLTVPAALAVLAAAALGGETAAGPDGNTQSIEATVSPPALFKRQAAPVSLRVEVKTGTTTAADGVPSPAVHDVIDFDRNLSLTTKGLPTCAAAKLQNTTTEVAERVCGKAKIGSGSAITLLPTSSRVFVEPTTVTAFNGAPRGGGPVVLLHAYGVTPIQTTLVLVGTVSSYGRQGYGPRLDVVVPPIGGGSGAITDFKVTIHRTWTRKGRKLSFIAAKCPASRKLRYRGAFSYADGVTITAASTQRCEPRPEPRRKPKKR